MNELVECYIYIVSEIVKKITGNEMAVMFLQKNNIFFCSGFHILT